MKGKPECSKITKACGFESVEQVARLRGVTSETIRKAFREDMAKYQEHLYAASQAQYIQHGELITKVMKELRDVKA